MTTTTVTYSGTTLRPRTLCTPEGHLSMWMHAPSAALRFKDAVPTVEAGRRIDANAKQDRPPREDLR